MARIFLPIRMTAWLGGELGQQIVELIQKHLDVPAMIELQTRCICIEADESDGVLLEAVHRAVVAMEHVIKQRFPVFYRTLGPVWTGSLQAVFQEAVTSSARL